MIKINEKYYLDSDSVQYILIEKSIVAKEDSKNHGKETFKNIAYYGTLENLKVALLEKEIKDNLDLLNNIDKVIELKKELARLGE
jgi:hypothetical protein